MPDFLGKRFLPPTIGKMGQKEAKDIYFFNLKKKLVLNFTRILFYNENLYYLLCSYTNLYLQKNVVPYGPKYFQPLILQDF